jgi:hypothetical protein
MQLEKSITGWNFRTLTGGVPQVIIGDAEGRTSRIRILLTAVHRAITSSMQSGGTSDSFRNQVEQGEDSVLPELNARTCASDIHESR